MSFDGQPHNNAIITTLRDVIMADVLSTCQQGIKSEQCTLMSYIEIYKMAAIRPEVLITHVTTDIYQISTALWRRWLTIRNSLLCQLITRTSKIIIFRWIERQIECWNTTTAERCIKCIDEQTLLYSMSEWLCLCLCCRLLDGLCFTTAQVRRDWPELIQSSSVCLSVGLGPFVRKWLPTICI